MSLIHEDSKFATLPQLEIFELPMTQNAVEYTYMLDVRPMSTVSEGSVVEFVMGGENRDYLYMKGSKIAVKMRVVHQDGSSIHEQKRDGDSVPVEDSDPDEVAFAVNNALHSLWNQVDVFVNGYRLSQASGMYAYKAIILTELGYGADAKKTQLSAQGYKHEKGDNLDIYSVGNSGMYWRQQLFKGSKTVEFEGPLLEDVMQLEKFLLNGMHVQVKLYPSLKKFSIMTHQNVTHDYKIELVDVVFRACMVKVNPGIIVGHATAMEKSNAVYPFTRRETKSYSVSKDTSNVYLDNLFPGNRPSKIVFGIVASDAFNGDYTRNPFKFHHYYLSDIKLIVDGQSVPGRPQKLDFDETRGSNFIQAYLNMYEAQGKAGKDYGGGITPEMFSHGHALFVYNLDPSVDVNNYVSLKMQSNVRLELNFAKPLQETVTVLIVSEHKTYFMVDLARNVLMPNNN
jgi:hypothetical protein